ncbi:sensor histidine kinase [Streptomyces sp. NPDC060205]|uniref:sensor histidine kinase n=1 Tax=Streptomyces sp. NPDC060205 TaxID=3347072 RepID=UPI003667E839
MNRASAWRDSWTGVLRRASALPRNAVFVATLGVLAIAESLTELVAERGSIPRMFATTTQNATEDAGSIQLAMVIGLLCLCTALPLALLSPVLAGLTVTAASFGSLTIFHTLTLAGFAAQLLAQYRLGRRGHHLAAMLFNVPFLVLAFETAGTGSADSTDYRVRAVLLAALAPMAAFTGLARHARRGDREHDATREIMAGSLWENAAREERARIVRELHDVVGHHVSMIAVQAETARVATPGMPAAGSERLLGIGDTARAALTEMRRLLGVLRDDDEPPAGAERRPQPDLTQLDDLLDEARKAGTATIRLILSGSPHPMGPGIELAAYRIVQESLTNARKHATGAPVDVELHYTHDALHVSIRDNGPGAPPAPPATGGYGLLGMRERVAAVGGQLSTGPADAGGFLVQARFPAEPERTP